MSSLGLLLALFVSVAARVVLLALQLYQARRPCGGCDRVAGHVVGCCICVREIRAIEAL